MDRFDKIVKMGKHTTEELTDYWMDYELYASLEYWMMVTLLVVPLLILFFKIDKNKIFLIGFYGYSFHLIFGYLDLYGKHNGLWNYPFPLIPAIPGFAIDGSLVPVAFMLVYQWTLNNNKNYYLYSFITALIFSFIIKPILVQLELFKLYENIKYFHLLIGYIFVLLTAKFITNVFLWTQKKFIKLT
ncbi:CBO0543 family protein [Bacillus sp. OTU2372]|uniref:CBO0543 family protein n=1 Tax=Bacillus sp. OTU2372 TaxID=3043858 RepID=UPI00313B32CD